MKESDRLQALDAYFRLMGMKGAVEVFHTASRAGVLKAVMAGASDVPAVAAACDLDLRATGLVLDALAAMGLVLREERRYSPAPVLEFFSGTYADLSAQYWAHLPQYLTSGVPMQRMDDPAEGMKAYAAQAASLYWMMLPSATAVASTLGIGTLRRNLRILDVGAGSGVWSLTFARQDPGAQVTAVDWPAVLQVADEMARRTGVAGRFTACPGDYHSVPFAAGTYDLAIAANIAHLESEERLGSVFGRLHAALKPGGWLLVVDVFHGQSGGELNAALYELGLALRTAHGRVPGRAVLEACVRRAGFADPDYQPIPVTPRTMGYVLARKEEK
jgi:SAM-dependent methyltransferase